MAIGKKSVFCRMMTPDELKRWQERHRYTGKRLAEELCVHPMTVTYWRSGKVAIPRTVELALKYLEPLPVSTTTHH